MLSFYFLFFYFFVAKSFRARSPALTPTGQDQALKQLIIFSIIYNFCRACLIDDNAKVHVLYVAQKLYTIPHAIDDPWIPAA